jgi:GT2 family glycosyltransferase
MVALDGDLGPAMAAPAGSISVVICTQDSGRHDGLLEGIASLAAQTRAPHEVVVIVDHNPELSRRLAAGGLGARIVDNSGESGLSGARNAGLNEATGEIVAYLDDDATAEPQWLAELAAAFDDPRIIAAGGAAVPVWESGRPRWFPDEFGWVVGCSYRGLPEQPAEIRNVIGCNMAFRRAALATVGGFSGRLSRSVTSGPVGAEETEFCIRLRRRFPGSAIWFQPSARVHHRVPAARATWRYFRSRCYHEGLSKGILTQMVGPGDGLASERRHALVTLPSGVLRGFVDILRGDLSGLGRSAAIVAGLILTGIGYLRGLRTHGVARVQPSTSEDGLPGR